MLMDRLRAAAQSGQIDLYPFHYSADFPVAAFIVGATVPISININNDSDFVIRQSMISCWQAAGVFVPNPDIMVSLFDTGSARNWQDQPQAAANILGNGTLPYIWPEPVLVPGGAVLTVTMTNIGPAAMLAHLTFSGIKVSIRPGYSRNF